MPAITRDEVYEALQEAVAGREGYVYRSDHDTCVYADRDEHDQPYPSCLVGVVLAKFGVPLEKLYESNDAGSITTLLGTEPMHGIENAHQLPPEGFAETPMDEMGESILAEWVEVEEDGVRLLWAAQFCQDDTENTWLDALILARQVLEILEA